MPAYAASLEALENREISPISPKMTAPLISPIPGIVVMGESILQSTVLISVSTSDTCASIKRICSISSFNYKEKLSRQNFKPKEVPVYSVVKMQRREALL